MTVLPTSSTTKVGSKPSSRTLLHDPFNRGVATFVIALFFLDIILARLVRLNRLGLLFDSWPELLLLAACLAYCLWRPLPRAIDAAVLTIWAMILSDLLSPLVLIAGRSPIPLADGSLWAVDNALHFSTAFFVQLAAHAMALRILLALCYPLVGPLVLLALLLPPLVGKPRAARRFLLAAALSAILTAGGFALWPAAGPWTTEGFSPSREQADITTYLHNLKSNSPVDVDPAKTAVVSFPSFHVALAITAALAIGCVRRIRVAAWVLTVLIGISTLTTGWHYGIDLLGGVLVAWISILAANWLESKVVESEF